jgi:hypothetical protein
MLLAKFNNILTTPIIITIFLIYHGNLLSLSSPSIEVSYGISFTLYCLAILYYNKDFLLKLNKWLLCSTVFVIIPLLVGIYMGWSLRDIFADTFRFLAPFVGYSAGLIVLKRTSYHKLMSILFFMGIIVLYSYYISLFQKIIHVADGGPVIQYAANGLYYNFLYFFIFINVLQNKVIGKFTAVLIIFYLVGHILSPLLLMSKSKTIMMIISVILVFFFMAKYKLKLLILAVSLIFISTLMSSSYSSDIFKRVNNFISVIDNKDYNVDPSTSFRIMEIINVTKTLINNMPYSIFFGMGSGALYYDVYEEDKGGVHAGNYRSDGGLHHIFMGYLGYLFRYGFVGLSLVLLWLLYVFHKLDIVGKIGKIDNFNNSTILSFKFYFLITLLSDLFVPVNIYGNMEFGYFLAIFQILAQKIINKNRGYLFVAPKISI